VQLTVLFEQAIDIAFAHHRLNWAIVDRVAAHGQANARP
jgi:hypothetical protein